MHVPSFAFGVKSLSLSDRLHVGLARYSFDDALYASGRCFWIIAFSEVILRVW
jgi:hypothetical protein